MVHVHQFVPCLLPQDAVGNHTMETHRALNDAGMAADIWAVAVHPELSAFGRPFGEFPRRATNRRERSVLLYQAASVSSGIADFVRRRPEPKVMSYHNLTPSSFYDLFDPPAAAGLREAAEEVRRLAEHVTTAIAASEFNAKDLRSIGVRDVHVVPPYLGKGCVPADPSTLAELQASKKGIDLLFVGRIVPNKAHLHLIRLMSVIRRLFDPGARLFLVGPPGPETYMCALTRVVDRLAPGAVIFTGPVSESELAAHYGQADVFVCMSEHEGFGIPLVEAMRNGVPVVAYDAGAVAETLGGAGVLLGTTDPMIVAEVVARVAHDASLRADLLHRQQKRTSEIEAFPRDETIVEILRKAAG
jgi:glycosyltransferase involved in cell wall biosynthesis